MTLITNILEAASILLFCGFMSIFMIPKLFFWIFYAIPQVFRFSALKKMYLKGLWPVVRRIFMWLAIIGVLYAVAFSFSIDVGLSLLISPIAIFSWILAAIIILWNAVISPSKIQDGFYNNVYLKYLHEDEKEKYDSYFEQVGKFTLEQALEEKEKKLDYLQSKAIDNRLHFLTNEKLLNDVKSE